MSLASDLAHDVPAESALRDALLSVRLAKLAGWPQQDVADAYYLALLYHVGCTAAVAEQSRLGDDVAVRRWLSEADFADRPDVMRISLAHLARQWGPADWARAIATFASFDQSVAEAFASLADVAARLASRLGAGPRVCAALGHAYARWDGKVFPASLPSREQIAPIARLVHLVHVAQIYQRLGGRRAADEVVRGRRGGEFDPELADLWLASSGDLELPAVESVWDEALDAEPEPRRFVPESHLEEVGWAISDFVDLKSPFTHRHSTQLTLLVEKAAGAAGLDGEEASSLHLAAQVHDLGNVSIPGHVWVKAGPLNKAEWERVRLHAYHSQRILSVTGLLRGPGEIAGQHHERIDGSGYHRGVPAAAIPFTSRLLMAAEVYQSMLEERSWRPALAPEKAAAELRGEAAGGRLDRRAVEAVLGGAGQASRGRRSERSWPAGLTDREVDVLRLLARGLSNREIAAKLSVSEATVHTHLINVYGKISVRTRAGATLFALENDLVQGSGVKDRPNG